MVSRHRLFSPQFVIALFALVGSALGIVLLHSDVIACTVGFRTSGQPLSPGQAAQCPGYEITSAILVVIALVAGAGWIWTTAISLGDRAPTRPDRDSSDIHTDARSRESPAESVPLRPDESMYRWVWLLAGIFFAVTFFAESWQYLHLAPFDDDLSINQQVLSSLLFGGKPYPFYEAFNCGFKGQCSYLLVHQAFFSTAVALPFALAPSPYTMFAIQSLAIALGALPLYLIAVDVLGYRRLSLVVAAAYLAWVPLLIIATRDTFNWESFIPVEILTVFYLWNRHRYLAGFAVAILAFLTYDVNPVLIFFVGLYFLWPWLVRGARLFYVAVLGRFSRHRRVPNGLRLWSKWFRTSLRVPEVYASLALMASGVTAYVLLRLFLLHGGWLLGLPPVPSQYAFSLSTPNVTFVFSLKGLSYMWSAKVWYWVAIFLTLGFIPLFAPRALLLVLPWVVFTFFNTTLAFWSFNGHYIFPSAAAVFIAFAFGLQRLLRWTSTGSPDSRRSSSTSAEASADSSRAVGAVVTPPHGRWSLGASTGSSRAATVVSFGVVVIIAGNLFLNPLNPLSASAVPSQGALFPSPYTVTWSPPTSDRALQELVSILPRNAVVTASIPLFSLVAEDPYAYPFEGPLYNPSLLPDNESSRLQYVLLALDTPPGQYQPTLIQTLYDRSDFGVLGCVANSAAGSVELFQRGYTGPAQTFGPADALCPNYFSGGAGLTPGENASVTVNSTSPSGVAIASVPCARNGSTVWTGPGIDLSPGTYTFEVVYSVYDSGHKACESSKIKNYSRTLIMNVTGENASGTVPVASHFFPVSDCTPTCGGWHYWNETITLNSATSEFSFTGTVGVGLYVVQVALALVKPVES